MKHGYKFRLHTGPTQVNAVADRLDGAGLDVMIRGTEHVHVWVEVPPNHGYADARDRVKWALGFEPYVVGWAMEDHPDSAP